MDKPNYYQRNRDVLLNKSQETNNKERIKNKSLSEDKKDYQREYRKNMIDEQKQRLKKLKINAIKINIIA